MGALADLRLQDHAARERAAPESPHAEFFHARHSGQPWPRRVRDAERMHGPRAPRVLGRPAARERWASAVFPAKRTDAPAGTVCPLSVSAFPITGDARSEALSADDRELLNAARGISDAMREMRVPGLSRLL
jgi:hypothetical protein